MSSQLHYVWRKGVNFVMPTMTPARSATDHEDADFATISAVDAAIATTRHHDSGGTGIVVQPRRKCNCLVAQAAPRSASEHAVRAPSFRKQNSLVPWPRVALKLSPSGSVKHSCSDEWTAGLLACSKRVTARRAASLRKQLYNALAAA